MNRLLDSRFPTLEALSTFLDVKNGLGTGSAETDAKSSAKTGKNEAQESLVQQRQAAVRQALAEGREITDSEFGEKVQSAAAEVLQLQQERELLKYAIEQITYLNEPAKHIEPLRQALIDLNGNNSDLAVELVETIHYKWYDAELSSRIANLESVIGKTGWPKSDPPKGSEVSRALNAVIEIELPQSQKAVEVLARPIAQRIQFHFQKGRDTARPDKPEWLFAYLIKLLDQRVNWISNELRKFVAEPIDKLLVALLPALIQVSRDNYDVNTHFISQLLQFSTELESKYWCPPNTTDAIVFGILGPEGLDRYLHLEQTNCRELLDTLLKTGSQKIDFDADAPCAKPTFVAENLRQMLQQADYLIRLSPRFVLREIHLYMAKRYAEWLDNQLDVYDRSHSSLARAVGTSKETLPKDTGDLEYLARIFGSSSYFKAVLEMWSTDLDVLLIKEELERLTEFYGELRSKGASRIANIFARDIQKQLKPYFNSDWRDQSVPTQEEISSSIKSAAEALGPSVGFMDRLARTSRADRARVMVLLSDSLAKAFWRLVIQANTFTKAGAGQLRTDMAYLWSTFDLPETISYLQNVEATQILQGESVPEFLHLSNDHVDGLKRRRVSSNVI